MATVAVMEALKESGMQHTARYQLNCLDEFEAVHIGGDENIPQHIVELRLIRPYLLDVASGTVVWDAEEVARRVKQGGEGTACDKAPGRPLGKHKTFTADYDSTDSSDVVDQPETT
jgi:hypothetical protein